MFVHLTNTYSDFPTLKTEGLSQLTQRIFRFVPCMFVCSIFPLSLISWKYARSLCLLPNFAMLKDKGVIIKHIISQKCQCIGTCFLFKDHPEYSGIHMVRFKRQTIYLIHKWQQEYLRMDSVLGLSLPQGLCVTDLTAGITPMPFTKTMHTGGATPSRTLSLIMNISAFIDTKPTRDISPLDDINIWFCKHQYQWDTEFHMFFKTVSTAFTVKISVLIFTMHFVLPGISQGWYDINIATLYTNSLIHQTDARLAWLQERHLILLIVWCKIWMKLIHLFHETKHIHIYTYLFIYIYVLFYSTSPSDHTSFKQITMSINTLLQHITDFALGLVVTRATAQNISVLIQYNLTCHTFQQQQ